MIYAQPSDLMARKDLILLGGLCSDDPAAIVSADDLPSDPNLAVALSDASGMIEMACLVGQRYLVTDLEGLTGNSQSLLIRLTCDLAFSLLRRRRGFEDDLPEYTQAQEILERLRKGEVVFNVAGVVDSGNPVVDVLNAQIQAQQGLVSSIAGTRWLPSRPYPR